MPRLPACLSLLALAAAAPAADWPQFRGPTGQGHADAADPPTAWAPDKNVAWRTELPGKGWSSPVTAAGRAYVTTAVADGGKVSLRAVCVDATSGAVVWDKEVFAYPADQAGRAHPKNSHASPTPVVDGGRLFVHFGHLGTACLNAADGARVWANQSIKYQPVHGNGGSPVLAAGRLIFSVDGGDQQFVVGLDRATGKVAWQAPRKAKPKKGFSFCTPLVITAAGREQVVCPGSDVVTAHDPRTGAELWRVAYSGYSVVPRPVFGNGLVYLSTGYDSPVLYAIRPDGAGDVTKTHVAWTATKNAPRNASPVLAGDALYAVSDNGILSCLDAKTGAERWTQRVPGEYSASPVAAGGRVYLLAEDGTATVFRPGPAYDPVETNRLGERALASYAVDGDALLVRTEKALYRIARK